MKVVWEIQKIFKDKKIFISCTAVRVPVIRAHSESIAVETKKRFRQKKYERYLKKLLG